MLCKVMIIFVSKVVYRRYLRTQVPKVFLPYCVWISLFRKANTLVKKKSCFLKANESLEWAKKEDCLLRILCFHQFGSFLLLSKKFSLKKNIFLIILPPSPKSCCMYVVLAICDKYVVFWPSNPPPEKKYFFSGLEISTIL